MHARATVTSPYFDPSSPKFIGTVGAAKSTRKVQSIAGDVNKEQRLRAFEMAYGKGAQRASCIVCEQNQVHLGRRGFEMSHIVPRSAGGNNRSLYNRLATCATCNADVPAGANMLDFIAENYGSRIETIVDVLWRQFAEENPTLASRYVSLGRRHFVQKIYGERNSTGLSHGAARSLKLFTLLTALDEQCSRNDVLVEEITLLSKLLAEVQNELLQKRCEERFLLLRNGNVDER